MYNVDIICSLVHLLLTRIPFADHLRLTRLAIQAAQLTRALADDNDDDDILTIH